MPSVTFIRKRGYGRETVGNIVAAIQELGGTAVNLVEDRNRAVLIQRNGPSQDDGRVVTWGYSGRYSDKYEARMAMYRATVICPLTYSCLESVDYELCPFVVRPRKHFGGNDFFVCDTEEEVTVAAGSLPNYYISKLINKVAEYRVYVVDKRVVWVGEKRPKEGSTNPAWNVHQGATMHNVRWGSWPLKVCREAVRAARALGFSHAAVDVVVDRTEIPYVLECNTAPSVKNTYWIACMAKAFLHTTSPGQGVTMTSEVTSYNDLIHPSLVIKQETS